MHDAVSAFLVRSVVVVLISIPLLAASAHASSGQPRASNERGSIELPSGIRMVSIEPTRPATRGSGGGQPTFLGDAYSFEHQIGALIDGLFQCFDVHEAGMDDNTVLFDSLSELLDPYLDGTQPLVFEFETPGSGPDETDLFFNAFTDQGGDDLFPDGFEDPETGTPLDSACLEIGIDDTLDADQPVDVTSAIFEASGPDGTIIPPTDITSFFENPWDGRLSIVFGGQAGQGIDGMVLEMTVEPQSPNIFSDGFESGDASAWQ